MRFWLLLQKRILNKKSFLAVLFLIIPVVAGIKFCSKQKSGILRIALVKSQDSSMVQQISDSLNKDIPAFDYIECQSQEAAQELIYSKKIDAAWIFDADFDSRIKKAGSEGRVLPVVTVLQGEDTVFLAYSREILYSRIFPLFSYEAYSGFVHERIGSVSQDDLQAWYLKYSDIPELFIHQTQGEQNVSSSYLLSPLRGMLAIWIFICGFAATLYYIDDIEKKRFVWLKGAGKSFGFYIIFVLIPLIDCSIVFFMAVSIGGIFTSFLREIVSLLLLIFSVIFFVNLLRLITRRKYLFCAAIPLLIILMLVLSPIFLKVNQFVPLQFVFPVYYYLNAVYSTWYLGVFALYTIILAVINVLIMRFTSGFVSD